MALLLLYGTCLYPGPGYGIIAARRVQLTSSFSFVLLLLLLPLLGACRGQSEQRRPHYGDRVGEERVVETDFAGDAGVATSCATIWFRTERRMLFARRMAAMRASFDLKSSSRSFWRGLPSSLRFFTFNTVDDIHKDFKKNQSLIFSGQTVYVIDSGFQK